MRGVFASGLLRRSFQLPGIRSSRAYLRWPRRIPPWCREYANWELRRIPVWCGEPVQHWSRRILPSWPHSSWDVVVLRRDVEIVENSSKRGRPKLIESQGYSYTLQRRRGLVTEWQCSIRPKVNPCRATVRQRGDQFQCGNHVHNHQAQVGALTAAKIKSCTRVQLWCPRCKKSTEGVFLPQRPSSFIKRLFLEPLRPAFVNLDDFRSLKTALLGATTCAKVMINANVL